MGTNDKNIVTKPIEDCLGIYLFRTVEELAANNFQYSPKRDLARVELHGERLEKVITPIFASINSLAKDAQVTDWVNNQVLPELRKLDIQSAKGKVLRQIDSMPSSKVRERIVDVISYIRWLEARGCAIDPGDEAFLHLTTEEQETFAREVMKQLVLVSFNQFRRLFLVALNWIRKGKMSFQTSSLVQEVSRFFPWRATLSVLPLAENPVATKKLLCSENRAVVEDRETMYNWGGDHNKAFGILDGALRMDLYLELKIKGWAIPGTRYSRSDSSEKPGNDELQLLQIGEFEGLRSVRKQSLPELLVKGTTGELRNYLLKASRNKLLGAVRIQNRRLGIEVPPDRSNEEKTENKIRKQLDKDLRALAGREVLDYEIQGEGGDISILDQAQNRQAFKEWTESQAEEEATVLKMERLTELSHKAKLTRRLRLVAKLYDKPNNEIALALYKAFGKKVKPGAIRALKHDLLKKLREAASQK